MIIEKKVKETNMGEGKMTITQDQYIDYIMQYQASNSAQEDYSKSTNIRIVNEVIDMLELINVMYIQYHNFRIELSSLRK